MFWRRLTILVQILLVMLGSLLLFVREWPAFGTEADRINAIVRQQQFDFVVWEAMAFLAKAEAALANGHTFLDEAERKQVVLDYLELLHQAQQLDADITRLYVDPAVTNPDTASATLQSELAQLHTQLAELQPLAEAILQDQVAAILVEEGFDLTGQAWPPVMMHMTAVPNLLVASPRDRIERIHQRSLVPGLTTPDKEEMETAVTDSLNLSALIVPLGGIGTYPAMIQETTNINWLAEVTAHEWSHHWMGFHPVGVYYGDPAVRVINETIASIIDEEIGARMIERFYPESVPPDPNPSAPLLPRPSAPPPSFDFNTEMAATRIRADELLAQGKIEEAESYMEARRQLFVENGYLIRKLNQAYFAFYGAYASQPGATGSDPTGPMLRDIRDHSPNLRAFMDTVSPIASFADLERIWQETSNQ
jgi:hypothetical protein